MSRKKARSATFIVFAVDLEVLAKVIRTRESLVAQPAGVRTDARVRTTMSGQLVGPRETPVAVWPRADKRLLAGMTA